MDVSLLSNRASILISYKTQWSLQSMISVAIKHKRRRRNNFWMNLCCTRSYIFEMNGKEKCCDFTEEAKHAGSPEASPPFSLNVCMALHWCWRQINCFDWPFFMYYYLVTERSSGLWDGKTKRQQWPVSITGLKAQFQLSRCKLFCIVIV